MARAFSDIAMIECSSVCAVPMSLSLLPPNPHALDDIRDSEPTAESGSTEGVSS
jgi:hypothetical protein